MGQSFCHFEKSCLLKCLFLSTSKVPKKGQYLLHKHCEKTLWILIESSLTFFMFDIARKNTPQNYFPWLGIFFFSKIWFFINLLGPKELILLLPQYLPEYSLNIEISSLEVCHTRYYEKKRRRNNLFTGKIALFFKTLCFEQPLRSFKNALTSYTVMVGPTCGPL